MNKIVLVGNLGKDPVPRTFPSGDVRLNVSLATSEKWRDRDSGELKEVTDWHNLVFKGRLAESVADLCKMGTRILVFGKMRYRKWTDDQQIERTIAEVHVDEWELQAGGKRHGDDQVRTPTSSDHGRATPQQAPQPANSLPRNDQPYYEEPPSPMF